jgi:c-di-AMP phosphodiesterase-like protein
MNTYAEMSAQLLIEAAAFFTKLAEKNQSIQRQMAENVATFRQMAELIKASPEGRIEHMSHGEMTARLLNEAATFFRSIGEQNLPLKEQMDQNADIYETVARIVAKNPSKRLENQG